MERVERATRHFAEGLNCAQSVLLAFSEGRLESATAARLAAGLGGGMGRAGETCGAVTGAVLVIGLLLGHADAADRAAKERCYQAARQFVDAFRRRNGTVVCRELLGLDLGTPEGSQRFRQHRMAETHCARFVRDAAEILEELLGAQYRP